jgi:uncharacterized membrane protein SpoIIM required for sporulation
VIIDLDRFITEERPYWEELDRFLERIESTPDQVITLERIKRFHYLYQRTSAGLAKINTFSTRPEIRTYLESLVERAYGEIHETRSRAARLAPRKWFFQTLPQTFRRHIKAFYLALAITMIGGLFGGLAVTFDTESKEAIIPFSHLIGSPKERVAKEESAKEDHMEGVKARFSTQLMTNNIKVSITAFALGISWGIGTIIILFYNGVILGAVAVDYVLAGETQFLLGWLLPHGSIEIPAILIAGQAGLVLARALIGWGSPVRLSDRFRAVVNDLITLICGVALFLVWAGIVESFMSQYHEPVLPYEVKIAFGAAELILLFWFLYQSGRRPERRNRA